MSVMTEAKSGQGEKSPPSFPRKPEGRAFVLAVGGEKGGTGKTTLATQIAALFASDGHDVLLVDTDPQLTASHWTAARRESIRLGADLAPVSCISLFGNGVSTEIKNDLSKRYGVVLIDAGGRDSPEFRGALVCADRLITPLKCSVADGWTIPKINGILTLAKDFNPTVKADIVLTMEPSVSKERSRAEVGESLEAYPDIGILNTVVASRKNYIACMAAGTSAVEMKDRYRDPKAVTEMLSLYREIQS